MSRKGSISLITGLVILALFLLMSFAPTLFTQYDRKEMFDAWVKPCKDNILGTNSLGYDVYTELVYGAKQTLLVGVSSSILSMLLGVLIGTLAAGRGFAGRVFSGLINIFVLIPRVVCLVVLAAFFGSSTTTLIALIAGFSWVATARNVKAKVENIMEQPFIESLKIQGFSRGHIVVFHVIPNLFDVLLSRFLLGINSCIMLESTLSFLGLGDLYYPTWGTMVNFAYKRGAFIRRAYCYLLMPGVCIMLLSLSFYFISIFIENRKESIG